MRNLLYILLVSLLIVSCKTKHHTPYDYTGQKIILGFGGGFAGTVTEYTILESGNIYKGTNAEGNVYELDKAKKQRVEQAFENYFNLGLDKVKWHNPGNMYKYIILRKNGSDDHKITWGDHDKSVPKHFNIYFDNIMSIIKGVNRPKNNAAKTK